MLRYLKLVGAKIDRENKGCGATNWAHLNKEIAFIEVILGWDGFTITQRLREIIQSLGDIKMTKWKLSRLFTRNWSS